MKKIVLSTIIVLVMLLIGAPWGTMIDGGWNIANDVSASASELSLESETLWLDTFSWYGYPTVYSAEPLEDGIPYLITIEGTWSIWAPSHWESVSDPPIGDYEDAPMYPSVVNNGSVGMDPFWAFACIYGADYAAGMGWTSLPTPIAMRISLDNGATWNDSIRPENDVYNSSHRYVVEVIGQGLNIGFRTIDAGADDNYGQFLITIQPLWTEHHPNCAITEPAGEYVNSSDVSMAWTMSDSVSGIDRAEVRLDSGDWVDKGNATDHTFTAVPDGLHTLTLKVFNIAGYNNSTSVSITVDTISPYNVGNSWSQPDASGTLTITFNEAMATVEGLIDGEEVSFSIDDINAIATVTLSPGTHELTMTGTDLAGNPLDYYFPFQFTVGEVTVPVSGRVLDNNSDPVEGAHVDIDGVQATTGADGWFFCSVTSGNHNISITKSGMEDITEQIMVPADGELGNFTLEDADEGSDGGGSMTIILLALLLVVAVGAISGAMWYRRKKK